MIQSVLYFSFTAYLWRLLPPHLHRFLIDMAATLEDFKMLLQGNNAELTKAITTSIEDKFDEKLNERIEAANKKLFEAIDALGTRAESSDSTLKTVADKLNNLDMRLTQLETPANIPLPDSDQDMDAPGSKRTRVAKKPNTNNGATPVPSPTPPPATYAAAVSAAASPIVEEIKDDSPGSSSGFTPYKKTFRIPIRSGGKAVGSMGPDGIIDLDNTPAKRPQFFEVRVSGFPDPLSKDEIAQEIWENIDLCHYRREKIARLKFGKLYDHYGVIVFKDAADVVPFLKEFKNSSTWSKDDTPLRLSVNKYGRDRVKDVIFHRSLSLMHDGYAKYNFAGNIGMCWSSGTVFVDRVPYFRIEVPMSCDDRGKYRPNLIKDNKCPAEFALNAIQTDLLAAIAA